MIPFKSPLLLTVPPTLEKKLQALAALRTLQAQDEELIRQRRVAIAALRRDFDELQREFAMLRGRLASDVRSDVLRMLKCNPDQPGVVKSAQAAKERLGASASSAYQKAAADDPEHPGWPAHTPGGRGGKFRPKDDESGVILAQDEVTPRGFTLDHVPGDPLDPQKLNGPILPDEQQKIAAALTIYYNNKAALHPHVYENRPDPDTGAVLPPSTGGYVAYDVPGLGSGRGGGRIIVDQATGAMYYTNNHYSSFYGIELHERPK